MASGASKADVSAHQPTIVDNFVPPKENFDGDTEAQDREEHKWELERDLAPPQDWQISEKEAREQALKHMSSGRRKRKETRNDSLLSVMCAYIVEHQIGLSVDLIALLMLTHALFPRIRPWTIKFFTLSYHDPSTGKYTQGPDDVYFVLFCIVLFTGLRASIMDYVLKPAARAGGIKKSRARVRFAEQAWLVLYYSASCSLGIYIWSQTPYWFNFKELWTNFPSQPLDGLMKWYYLVQFGFWLQQILVVNIEEHRNDYAQMFTHHIFTSTLLLLSYGFYQTKVGNVFLSIMDVVDPLLSLAKCLRYLSYQTACDITFGIFLFSWLFFRHIVYNLVCWSIYVDLPVGMPDGCFDAPSGKLLTSDISAYPFGNSILPNVMNGWIDPRGVICNNHKIAYSFLGLLLALQVITLIWFGMIVRVAWGVITGRGADDSRSDEEDAADSEDEVDSNGKKSRALEAQLKQTSQPPNFGIQRPLSAGSNSGSVHSQTSSTDSLRPLEQEVTADQLHLPVRTSSPRMMRRKKSGGGRTSALSIPGHSDPKDILNRIGCETKTTDQE